MATPVIKQQHRNGAEHPATATCPTISPRYISPHKRRLTSELRQALPPLMLLGNESSSSFSSSSILSTTSSSSLSYMSTLERQKRTLSFGQQLRIADEPLRRMLQEKQQQIHMLQSQQHQESTAQLQHSSSSFCSEHSPSLAREVTKKVVPPRSLTLCAPSLTTSMASELRFL